MRNLRLGITLVAFSVFALLILDFVPGSWVSNEKFLNGTVSYVIVGSIFYGAVHFLGLQSLEYFRIPRLHFKAGVAIALASVFAAQQISDSDNIHLQPLTAVRGIIFLLAIGFGEEMVSRAFTFGILRKFGQWRAIFISSLIFGLMHLNPYIGTAWDPWKIYGHIMSAFGFGIFICALMIVTRSIWVAVLFHALSDWGVVFDKASSNATGTDQWNPGIWEGITFPLYNVSIMVGAALLLLWINRATLPGWMHRLAIKWKLLEPDYLFKA